MKTLIKHLVLATLILIGVQASALSSGDITITNGTGPHFYSDDGNCGSSEVPTAAYLSVNVENTGSDTLWSVAVKLTSISNSVDGFNLLSNTDDSTITISRILPGETQGAFFYVEYPCVKNRSTDFNFVISDNQTGTVNYQTSMTTLDIQPANAGGDILNQVVVGLDLMGILIADTVTYEFGNYNGGHMVFQPSGDPNFPADQMELIGNKIVASDFSGCGLTSGTTNVLYFNNATGCGAGSGNEVKVVYYYINSLFNDTAVFKPYSAMKSGGPVKYSSNYGDNGSEVDTFITTINSNKISIYKDGGCGIYQPGDTMTVTIGVINSSTERLMFDYIEDSIPNGFQYLGFADNSDVNSFNSGIQPNYLDSGSLTWVGRVPTDSFPYRTYVIEPNDTLKLIYQVKLPGVSSDTFYDITASATVGSFKLDSVTCTVCVGCSALPVEMIYFKGESQLSGNKITWATASEENNKGFDLYKKNEFGEFEWLAFIDGMGTTSQISNYEYFDYSESTSTESIYQLIQSDYNGVQEKFLTVVYQDQPRGAHAQFFPNPVDGNYAVISELPMDATHINIKSMSGVTIRTILVESNTTMVLDDLDALRFGMYIIEVVTDNHATQVIRMIKS
jgi:hypothetical protein